MGESGHTLECLRKLDEPLLQRQISRGRGRHCSGLRGVRAMWLDDDRDC